MTPHHFLTTVNEALDVEHCSAERLTTLGKTADAEASKLSAAAFAEKEKRKGLAFGSRDHWKVEEEIERLTDRADVFKALSRFIKSELLRKRMLDSSPHGEATR